MADEQDQLASDANERPNNASRRPPGSARGARRSVEDAPRGGIPTFWVMLLVGMLVLFIYQWQTSPERHGSRVDYSFFLSQLDKDNIEAVHIDQQNLIGKWKKAPANPDRAKDPEAPEVLKDEFNTVISTLEDRTLITRLQEKGVEITETNQSVGFVTQIFFWTLPLILL